MLPELPSLPAGQFPILQQWFGLGSLILILFGIFLSVRKMLREDRAGSKADEPSNSLANFPKYYLEGPLVRFESLLVDIKRGVDRIERRLDGPDPPDRRRR